MQRSTSKNHSPPPKTSKSSDDFNSSSTSRFSMEVLAARSHESRLGMRKKIANRDPDCSRPPFSPGTKLCACRERKGDEDNHNCLGPEIHRKLNHHCHLYNCHWIMAQPCKRGPCDPDCWTQNPQDRSGQHFTKLHK